MPSTLGVVASARSAVSSVPPIPTTGLGGWWDADDASTFTLSGVAVSQWRDKSGNNRHFAKGVPSAPSRDATINGRTALRFNGAHQLETPAFAAAFTAAELFVVVMNNSATDVDANALLGDWSGDVEFYPYIDGTVYEPWGTSTRQHFPSPPSTLRSPHIYNVRSASGSYVAAMNGAVYYSTAANAVSFGTVPYKLGQSGSNNVFANDTVGEVIVYNRVLSTTERQQVESYLSNKWGTPSSLVPSVGLAGWWDAAALTGANGSRITSWPDKSGAGRTLTGPGPTLTTNALNGKSVATFNLAADNSLRIAAAANLQQFFVVTKYNLATFASYSGLITDNDTLAVIIGDSVSANWWDGTAPATYYKDGAVFGKPWPGPMQNWATIGLSYNSWGSFRLQIGADRAIASRWWDGGIAEIIAYDRILSTVERQQVESYLKTKWGTPSLPTLPITRVEDGGGFYYVLQWVPGNYTNGQEFDALLTVEAGVSTEDQVYCDSTTWNFFIVAGSVSVDGKKVIAKGPVQGYRLRCDLGGAGGTKRLVVVRPTDITI